MDYSSKYHNFQATLARVGDPILPPSPDDWRFVSMQVTPGSSAMTPMVVILWAKLIKR